MFDLNSALEKQKL